MEYSNHSLAKKYMEKAKLLGGLDLELLLLNNDEVALVSVKDNGSKRIVLPSFITSSSMRLDDWGKYCGPLYGTSYTDVVVECNIQSLRYLCAGMVSDKLNIDIKGDRIENISSLCMNSKAVEINIKVNNNANIEDISGLFNGCENLKSYRIDGLNSKSIKNIKDLFKRCKSLKEIDLSFLKGSKLVDMRRVFNGCEELVGVDLSMLDTSNVTSMTSIFRDCHSLEWVNLKGLKTDKLKYMNSMFEYCVSLKSVDLSGFKTSRVENMSKMFKWCNSLERIDISNFSSDSLIDMNNMFSDCKQLIEIDMSNLYNDTRCDVTDIYKRCFKLKVLRANKLKLSNIRATIERVNIFNTCNSLEYIMVGRYNKGSKALRDIKKVEYV